MTEPQYALRYAELVPPLSMRGYLRHGALTLLAAINNNFPNKRALFAKNRVHFIYLHYVFQDEEVGFEALLDWLCQTGHQFISYSEAVERVASGQIDNPYVCFSFDDGVANCLTAGKILQRFGAKSCFFLNTSALGDTNQVHNMLMTRTQYGRLPVQYLSWADVAALQEMGHEIGGHTHSHVEMSQLSREELEAEIYLNKELLEARFGPIKHFAWPFGRMQSFSSTARDVVFRAGYESCASAERGTHVAKADNSHFCIHRDGVVAAWPLSHTRYLLMQSIAQSTAETNSWKGLLNS